MMYIIFNDEVNPDDGTIIPRKMIMCPECEGEMPVRSDCCFAPIDEDILICHDCKEHAELAVCERCDGKGEVEA